MGEKIASLFVEIGGDDKKLQSTFSSIKGDLSKLANIIGKTTAAVAVIGTTMKKAFDLGKEGAQIIQTRESFETLLKSVGAGPDVLKKLRDASHGTVSDLQIMSSTSALVAGSSNEMARAMLDAAPRLMEIAKAANKLNPALGDVNFQYNSLALGIKRSSPMILDNLGLTIKVSEANEKYARSLGKTADQLTAEEQKMALLNATLEAGGSLINQVGGNTESLSDSYERLNVATGQIVNKMKEWLVPVTLKAADATVTLLTWNEKLKDAYNEHIGAVEKTAATYDEYRMEVIRAADAAGILDNRSLRMAKALQEGRLSAEAKEKVLRELSATLQITDERTWSFTKAAAEGRIQVQQYASAANDATASTFDLGEKVYSVTEALNKYSTMLLYTKASAGLTASEQMALARSLGLVDENTAFALARLDSLRQNLADGTITIAEYRKQVADLDQVLKGLSDKTVTVTIDIKGLEELNQLTNKGIGEGKSGNIIARAIGGPAQGWTRVGEHGMELIDLPGGSRVVNNQNIREALRGAPAAVNHYYNLTVNQIRGSDIERDFFLMRGLA